MKSKILIAGLVLLAGACWAERGKPSKWVLTKADMNYVGGFRLPKGSGGSGKNDHFAFSPGVIAYDGARNSFFAAGHGYAKAIAEISYPGLTASADITKLPRAKYVQNFRNLLDGLPSGNPDKVGVIGGLYAYEGAILFTAFQYYDAAAKVKDCFGIVQDSGKLAASPLAGYFETGYGAHTAGWVTPIPEEYQKVLKGDHIIGAGKSQPIVSRWPARPTAFAFTWPKDNTFTEPLAVTRILDGSLGNLMPEALWHKALDSANYGIIIPGTRTYVCFGNRGGMHSTIGYKIKTDDGHLAGGYTAQDDDDHYMYYWMFKVDDMVKAAQGKLDPVKVLPYEHGKLALPFVNSGSGGIGGGSWDPKTKTVFLCINGRDRASRYSILPVIVGVKFEKYKGKDTTAPYGVMTEPNNNKKVKGQIPIEAHAIDNVDKEDELKVQFTVNGKNYGKPATAFPFRIDWHTAKVKNGKYTLSAIALDKAGNKRKLNDVTVTVEN